MNGMVLSIQRMSLHDGPGIRTTVFLKGCPMRCLWCHNPESYLEKPQLMFYRDKCVHCGACQAVCTFHTVSGENHSVDFEGCTACGKCTDVCPHGALQICGREMTAEAVINEVLKDTAFYTMSGGGMTLSGGEPLFQPAFAVEIARLARERGVSVCLETAGCVPWDRLERISPYIDVFLYDCKETNPHLHKKYTGADMSLIRENLHKLNDQKKRIVLRCPIVPGYNDRDDHFAGIARIADGYPSVERIDLEPYHSLGLCKREQIGMDTVRTDIPIPAKMESKAWADKIRSMTAKEVVIL